jgi:RNA-binding protein YhbY
MNYRLEDISADDFEKLVNELCRIMLGIGVVDFSKGRDGGRDGRLTGTANEYPTKVNPWTGRFIIQAKHTEDYKASCSNNGFHGNKSSLVNGEIDKLNKLIGKGEIIDNYLIFTNRKEAESREAIIKHIKTQTNITNVDVIGNATISSWIFKNDALAKQFKLGFILLYKSKKVIQNHYF